MSSDPVHAGTKLSDLRILVLGDVNLDTLLVPLPRGDHPPGKRPMTWEGDAHYRRFRRRGGAWLLCDMINSALRFKDLKIKSAKVYSKSIAGGYEVTDRRLESSLKTPYLESCAILGLFPKTPGSAAGKRSDQERVYRITEEVPGWIDSLAFLNAGDQEELEDLDDDADWRVKRKEKREEYLQKSLLECLHSVAPETMASKQDIVVLHDRDGHFRRLDRKYIHKYILGHLGSPGERDSKAPWVVWQMYSPLATGTLWETVSAERERLDRIIAVVKVECLRQAGMNLPEGISLEKESQNFLDSIKNVPALAELAKVRHMLVHFHRQGVLHYDREKGLRNSCYFCPDIKEDPDQTAGGRMAGYTSILVAALVRGLAWRMAHQMQETGISHRAIGDGILDGLKQGVVLNHRHHLNGYARQDFHKSKANPEPYDMLFDEIGQVTDWSANKDWKSYRIGALELPKDKDLSKWSRIEGFIDRRRREFWDEGNKWTPDEVCELLACKIVRFGLEKVINPEPDDRREDRHDASDPVGSSRVDLQACKLEYSIVSPK